MGRGELSAADALLRPRQGGAADPRLKIKTNEEVEAEILSWLPEKDSTEVLEMRSNRRHRPYGAVRGAPDALSLCAGPILEAPSDRGYGTKLWRAHIGLTPVGDGEWEFCAFTTHGKRLGEQTNLVTQSADLATVVKKVNSKIQSKIRDGARSQYSPQPGTGEISDSAKFELRAVRGWLEKLAQK